METIISIFFGILTFCIVMIMLYKKGLDYEIINRRLSSISASNSDILLDEDLNKTFSERFFKPLFDSVMYFIRKYTPDSGLNKEKDEKMKKLLRQAGMLIMPSDYSAIRVIIILGTSVFFLLIGSFIDLNILFIIFMPLFGAYTAYTLMRFNLMSRIKKRKEALEGQMPDVLDMISVNVEAGLAFEQAILHVIEHFEGPLVDELAITYREMSMGRARREALMLLGERCDIDDMKSFTGAVIQAGKMGISLKNVLRTQASSIRQNRRNRIEEKAMKISVKMLLPMVLFIFPVIFIVLLGPAAIRIIEMFGVM